MPFDPTLYAGGLPSSQPAPGGGGQGLIASLPGALWGGLNEGASQLWAGVRAVADLTGPNGVSDFAQRAEQANKANAAAVANPAYEGSPFEGGVLHAVPWAIYNFTKALPQFAGIAAGAETGGPEATALQRLMGGAVAGAPLAAGQAYQATEGQGGRAPGQGNAAEALTMTPALAALNAWMPGHAVDLMAKAAEGGVLKQVAMHGLVSAAAQAPIAGVQTALIDSANPNLTTQERTQNIVDAAIGGGVMGGFIGGGAAGLGAIRAARRANASNMSTEQIGATVDEVLGDQAPPPPPTQQELPLNPQMPPNYQGEMFGQPPTISQVEEEQRPLKDEKIEDLQVAHATLANMPNIDGERAKTLLAIQQELAARAKAQNSNQSLTTSDVQGAAGAVERSGDVKSGVADQGSAVPAPAPHPDAELTADQLADIFKGVNWRVKGVYKDAKTLNDIRAINDQNADSKTVGHSLVQDRLNALLGDRNADKAVDTTQSGVPKPNDQTALADKTDGKTPAPAAPANGGGGDQPVDADFQKQWTADLKGKSGLAVDALKNGKAGNLDDARMQLFQLLGASERPADGSSPAEDNVSNKGKDTDGYKGIVDLSKKYGILDDDGKLTDLGADIARKAFAAEGPDEEGFTPHQQARNEAASRGMNLAESDAFSNGARGEDQTQFGSLDEMKAYEAGRDWSATRAASDLTTDKMMGYKDDNSENPAGKLKDRTAPEKIITSDKVPEDRWDQQKFNNAIDAIYSDKMQPDAVAQLKQMVRDGATSTEIDKAAEQFMPKTLADTQRYMDTGHGAFAQVTPGPDGLYHASAPFKGEVLDPTPGRRAMLEARQRARAGEDSALVGQAQKARLNAQKVELRKSIQGAVDSGDITPLDQYRLQGLLGKNDLQGVIDRLPGGKYHGTQVDTQGFLNRLSEVMVPEHHYTAPDRSSASPNLQLKLMSGDHQGALGEIAKNSASPLNRLLARKLGGDWLNKVTLRREEYDPIRTGRAILNRDGSSVVQLFGKRGMSEETFLHEMIHAFVHQKWLGGIEAMAGKGHAIVDKVNTLHDQIVRAIEKAYPELTQNEVWADQVRASPDEMITWAMTNPEAQDGLKRIDINGNRIDDGKTSLWDQFKGFVADLLGIPTNGRTMSALDHILQAGHSLLDANEQVDAAAHVPTPIINDRLTATVKTMADKGGEEVKGLLDRLSVKGKLDTAEEKAFPFLLQTQSGPHLAKHFGIDTKLMSELVPWQRLREQRDAIPNVYAGINRKAFDEYTKLAKADKKAGKSINNIAAATLYGINGEKAWKDHTWLHNDPRASVLKPFVDQIHRETMMLKAKGQLGVYHGLRDLMRVQNDTMLFHLLHGAIEPNPALAHIAEKLGDPLDGFVTKAPDQGYEPASAAKYWRDTLNNALTSVEKEFQTATNNPALSADERAELTKQMNPALTLVNEIKSKLAVTEQVPYFHAYREGDHMVSATFKTGKDGRPDPASVRALAEAVSKKGFQDFTISPDLSNPKIFFSVDNSSQRKLLEPVLKDLAAKGHLVGEIKAGMQARTDSLSPASQKALEGLVARTLASPLFDTTGKTAQEKAVIEKQKGAVEQSLREAWLNSLGSNSSARVMAHRDVVQGYSKDFIKATNFRYGVGAQAIARMWARPRMGAVIAQMETRARNAMNIASPQHADVDKIRMLVNNVRQRDATSMLVARHDWTDALRTWSNIFHIGASPAMMLVDGSQFGVMVVPHLGARHGYSNTLSAAARAAPIAIKIVGEALKQGYGIGGLVRAADVALTPEVLQAAVKDDATRAYIAHLIGRGAIDTSSTTHAMTNDSGIGSSPNTGKLLRMAAAMPQMTEVMSRIVTGLAARELFLKSGMKGSVEDYGIETIADTLGHYGQSSVPPILTKTGTAAGRLGPMMLQFKMFDMNLIWKLAREFHLAFVNKDAAPADRAVAQKFLFGHLAVGAALAGTLGLPFAGAITGAIDKLKDEFWPSDHPFDVTGLYRDYLSNMFGKEVGQVIAKGVPNAVGFDLSTRIGEGDILPLTQFLQSRQSWSDTMEKWQADALGAPASMIADQLRGLDQIHNGNVLGGMSTMLPTAFRNPLRAYQMTEKGYVDSYGYKLPMPTPGAGAILSQLVGLTPTARADYSDKEQILKDTKASLTYRSNALKTQLVQAMISGNGASARALIPEVMKFDAANPAYRIMPKVEREIMFRQQGMNMAEQMDTPIVVNPRDTYTRSLTNF